MAINISNQNVEKLLDEIIQITGESRTDAIRKALEERRRHLMMQTETASDAIGLQSFLQGEVWPQIPSDLLGTRLTKQEEEHLLGYGEQGA